MLGYNDTYHGFSASLENPMDCDMWFEALEAKYNKKGKAYGREEFDKLLGHCQVPKLLRDAIAFTNTQRLFVIFLQSALRRSSLQRILMQR